MIDYLDSSDINLINNLIDKNVKFFSSMVSSYFIFLRNRSQTKHKRWIWNLDFVTQILITYLTNLLQNFTTKSQITTKKSGKTRYPFGWYHMLKLFTDLQVHCLRSYNSSFHYHLIRSSFCTKCNQPFLFKGLTLR